MKTRVKPSKSVQIQSIGDSPPLSVLGTRVIPLLNRENGDGHQVTYQTGEEGAGPPPHSHAWDETFFVTRGRVKFVCAGRSTVCHAGSLVHVPGGTVHAFSYGRGGGELLEITGTGSRANQMFAAIDRAIPPGPPDLPKVVGVLGEHGVTVKGG